MTQIHAEVRVAPLAVAVGTAHGATKFRGEPRLDFERLEAIAALVGIPIVLHGASALAQAEVERAERYGARLASARGIPEELIRKAIGLGVSKVNTDSDLRLAALARLRGGAARSEGAFRAGTTLLTGFGEAFSK